MTDIKTLEHQLVGSVMVRMLVQFRKQSGMSVEQVAELMNTTIAEVEEFENSHDPMATTAMDYARIVGTRIVLKLSDDE
jgi:transcriptional regulator with XRE-family HTH domain